MEGPSCFKVAVAVLSLSTNVVATAQTDGAAQQLPERMRQDFHNLFVMLLLALLAAWVAKVVYQIFRAAEVHFRLTRSRSLQLEAMSIYAQEFPDPHPSTLQSDPSYPKNSPTQLVSRQEVFAHVHPESIRCLWVGEEDSGGGPMGLRCGV